MLNRLPRGEGVWDVDGEGEGEGEGVHGPVGLERPVAQWAKRRGGHGAGQAGRQDGPEEGKEKPGRDGPKPGEKNFFYRN